MPVDKVECTIHFIKLLTRVVIKTPAYSIIIRKLALGDQISSHVTDLSDINKDNIVTNPCAEHHLISIRPSIMCPSRFLSHDWPVCQTRM